MDSATIKEYRQKVLNSSSFESSQMLRDLFSYLVDCSVAKKPPKETTIAIEVFGKRTDFNSSQNPIVRVYVSKLRRKLADYYQDEGKHDKVRFHIPPGHYEIDFQSGRKSVDVKKFVLSFFVALFWGILLFIIAYLLFWPAPMTPPQTTVFAKHIFWDDFMKSNEPINVVLADQYIFRETLRDSEYVLSRDYFVNSDNDLADFQQRYPKRKVSIENQLPQFDKNSIWGLQYILPVLTGNPHRFFFTLSSELKTKDLRNQPTIYVGSMVELRLLNSFFQHYGLSFGTYPNYISIYYADADSTEIIEYNWDELGFHNDYAIVAKLPGPDEQPVGVFASILYSGNYAAAKYMSNPELLTELENAFIDAHGYIPRYFISIFKVRGFKRVDFDLSIRKTMPIEE